MKFLNESYEESEELKAFIAQLDDIRFNTYYVVISKHLGKETITPFADKSEAEAYYMELKNKAESDLNYYDGANITLSEIKVIREEDELESVLIDKYEGE